MSGGGGTSPTPTLNAKEKTAQLFTDYYEGEVSIKPSNLRAFQVTYAAHGSGKFIKGIVPNTFKESPYPVILLKDKESDVCTMYWDDTVEPYRVSRVALLEPQISVESFMQQQELAENGFLLIGWVNEDDSLIGMEIHPDS